MSESAHLQHPGRPKSIVFVDGENISALDIAYVNVFFDGHEKYIYQTDHACRKRGYPGFVHVIPPRMGKETVDKVIGMDVVEFYHRKGCRDVILVSNDRDFAATAMHLKSRHPDLSITIMCDAAKITTSYVRRVTEAKIMFVFMQDEDAALDAFACRVVEVIRELYLQNRLDLPCLGATLRERGIEYKKLKQDLIDHGILVPGSTHKLMLTQSALRSMNVQEADGTPQSKKGPHHGP